MTLAEHELLQANIPASYIKSITTPSGMKIELRDSIKTEQKRKTADGQRDNSDSKNSTKSVTEGPDLGFISINFERNKKQQDSTVTKTQKEQKQSEVQQTDIETSGSWLTWIVVGIAIALALVLAGMIFLN
ncbi:hypothetical protein [Fodinibius sp.]|uniref:hypothetical protein n=1 Tax=Fodinibius sp. TaxID=1872440 RepID=UPI002ACE62E4|nr:hypothetical protein [Fodinibius sp.]MDZ7658845.1 hypothetical protein [Fodinibius sp.]